MKRLLLQINARGSWSNVVEFEATRERELREAVVPLAQAIALSDGDGGKNATSFRLVAAGGGRSPKVLARLEAPGFVWRKA
jgi:hypothetical protein